MPIIFHETDQVFHLHNNQISYVMQVLPNGQLAQLYFGAAIRDTDHLATLARATYPFDAAAPDMTIMEQLQREYPDFGTGDMRAPAFALEQANGSHVTNFVYSSAKITPGKPQLPGLPATYVEAAAEATTLAVTLVDALIHTKLILTYTIFENRPVVTRSARFESDAAEALTMTRAMSLSLDLPDQDYEMLTLNGAWARERQLSVMPLTPGVHSVGSVRGHSSAQFNPFVALKRPTTTENSGEVLGFSLVYSGNFLAQVEADPNAMTRVMLGIHPDHFAWRLDREHTFQTPEVVMTYAAHGLNEMSQTFHELFRTRLCRGPWRDKPRPILINNWEATYFDFDEEKILSIARLAKQTGIEMFVLDDGWFGKRNDDRHSLGDWQPNLTKLPGGIAGLATKINALGLRFGLWFEPEMVNPQSDLYAAHPDWVLATPERPISVGRHQYVLDFSRPEVVDAIYQQMHQVLAGAAIDYVKWDMNRSLTEVFSQGQPAALQGEVYHKFILGVYDLYERLISDFPHILFESCASGGARFDAGMLYYAPQAWTSDDTDAVERQKIQYGTSLVYPLSSISAHVSAVPNEQVGRTTPLATRANVALFGTFGYELDLAKLSAAQLAEVSRQVAFMKQYRALIQGGTFYRLLSPYDGDREQMAWMVVAPDKKRALVGYYRTLAHANGMPSQRLRLRGLDEGLLYHVSLLEEDHYGDELQRAGLRVTGDLERGQQFDGTRGDFQSRVYVLTAVE
ncbi:alpha-galactosidase [Lacticaseibacillus mingshuiensis]|uniref:Alpha-galactosidase n=1 Tax=Lacticaseibacillus mingshuiensis TaxID=2799574 RepID=A0ABW4CKY3_9LACO|nr:alpha-galactosidase [Lacticaseibacillus mingshuiensis]